MQIVKYDETYDEKDEGLGYLAGFDGEALMLISEWTFVFGRYTVFFLLFLLIVIFFL